MDVTMLASEFTKGTDRTVPKDHPDYENFDTIAPLSATRWTLFSAMAWSCVPTSEHPIANTTKHSLSTSQLILGLQRITQGGTLIMLLHKIDSWAAASILHTFMKFAKVQVFKPSESTTHAPPFT